MTTQITFEDKIKWMRQLVVFQKNIDKVFEWEYGYKQKSSVPLIESIIQDLINYEEMPERYC